jgi:hypothetical protein
MQHSRFHPESTRFGTIILCDNVSKVNNWSLKFYVGGKNWCKANMWLHWSKAGKKRKHNLVFCSVRVYHGLINLRLECGVHTNQRFRNLLINVLNSSTHTVSQRPSFIPISQFNSFITRTEWSLIEITHHTRFQFFFKMKGLLGSRNWKENKDWCCPHARNITARNRRTEAANKSTFTRAHMLV